ncbi:glycosyltransferase family 2 protein [Gelidibacter salicanalis]|uniref:Glycosyltransferase n=1 Tax=Gelidibacter salicanalis TaxID=291193 RepID=A0A934KJD3_9FLAO|nr:glycosyltransferase [Gelidibacter salicanalis]MBJ7880566.1 glycosyltransferase [Gelidibacter salicanalis]
MTFKEYQNSNGEFVIYVGQPDLELLDKLSLGDGDIWHSSFDQGYKNAFQDIVYQTVVFFWFINDFDDLDECVSWRINPNHFAIRKTVWEQLGGFDSDYQNKQLQALDFGFNALRNSGAIPYYVKGLFTTIDIESINISTKDRYIFYRKNFKIEHSIFMLYRKGFWKLSEWGGLLYAKKNYKKRTSLPYVESRELKDISGNPTVSYIIPTMMRQNFTVQLLQDLLHQEHQPSQVIVVDATPFAVRDESLYNPNNFPFEVQFVWQTTKGSCRARNQAIDLCKGDYIIFGDDDLRLPPNFIKNHIRLLQTYDADACNGLDVRADHQEQTLVDLYDKLKAYNNLQKKVGAALTFNNANTCVKRTCVNQIIGNDVNYDGGYGEDSDFGLSLLKIGVTILQNPYSANLHLKPALGGYRFWGSQAKIMGKRRKAQPWELDVPVKHIRPVPSPTIMYQIHKHYTSQQLTEYKYKYFAQFLFKGNIWEIPFKFLKMPYRLLQFQKSVFYAEKLMALGKRTY